MNAALQLELVASGGVAIGLAILIGHEVLSRVLAVLGTVLCGVVLVLQVAA